MKTSPSPKEVATPLHYAGHIISSDDTGRFPRSMEQAITHSVAQWIQNNGLLQGFGSLASGADLIIVEQLLRHKMPVTLVLPFPAEYFLKTSVSSSGEAWEVRFNTTLEKIGSPIQVFDTMPNSANLAYSLTTLVALGAAKHLSDINHKKPLQLTVWDEEIARPDAGTYADQMKAKAMDFDCFYIQSKTAQLKHQTARYPDIQQTYDNVMSGLIIVNGKQKLSFQHFIELVLNHELPSGTFDFREKDFNENNVHKSFPELQSNAVLLSSRLFAVLHCLRPHLQLTCDSFNWSEPPEWIKLCP